MYFDTHAHFTLCKHISIKDHISLLKENNVRYALDPGLNIKDFENRYHLLKDYPEILFGVAIAPHYIKDFTNNQINTDLLLLEEILKTKRIHAIAEIGLEFFHVKEKKYRNLQQDLFLQQLLLAKKYHLPVFLHIRNAYQEAIKIVKESQVSLGAVHCFSGNLQDAKEFLNLGFYLSFSGIVTFKNATDLQSIAKFCPIDKLLTETDAPYLSPVPFRGKKNVSSNILHINHFLSHLKTIDLNTFNEILFKNATNLLKII